MVTDSLLLLYPLLTPPPTMSQLPTTGRTSFQPIPVLPNLHPKHHAPIDHHENFPWGLVELIQEAAPATLGPACSGHGSKPFAVPDLAVTVTWL